MPKPPKPPKQGISNDAFAIMVMVYYAAAKASHSECTAPPGTEALEKAIRQAQLIVDRLTTYTSPT